jgi:hypothetical protein
MVVLALAFLVAVPQTAVMAQAGRAGRPNIIFIMTDDHAAHAIGAYGSRVNQTRHLDRLAKEGALLASVFATNSICTPSRAEILTGQYSHINGVTMFNRFDSSRMTVARLLQQGGKWHLGSDPVGFDQWEILRRSSFRDGGLFAGHGVGAVCSADVAWGQAVPQVRLSGELRDHLRDERFQIVTSLRGLPLGVRLQLQTLFGSQTLDIAEPGEAFQASGATANPQLPIRRLAVAGCSYEHCLVYYQRGGGAPTWRVALFHWTPNATRLEFGGAAPAGLTTVDDLRRAVLSGAVRGPAELW